MAKQFSLLSPIFGSHVSRIGFIRVLVGGFSMYMCVPPLIIVYFTVSLFLYQVVLRPIFGTRIIHWADFVIIDRHRIEELSWFDKLNCQFCGYANGICTMINVEIDEVAKMNKISFAKKLIVIPIMIAYLPLLVFVEFCLHFIYDVMVATPLGMHRVSWLQASKILKKEDYAKNHSGFIKWWIRVVKNAVLRFDTGLEQIESSWCPLNHFEKRKGVVYPRHHEKFFGPDQIEEMLKVLQTVGTVSDRVPKY